MNVPHYPYSSYESMSSTASSSQSYTCASVADECLYHTTLENHTLFNGQPGEQIQLHVLRRSEYPHAPYLYCYSNEDCDNYMDFPIYRPVVSAQELAPSEISISSKASSFTYREFEHHVTEIIYDYDFANANYDSGRRVELYNMQPSWTGTSVNISLLFSSQSDASCFIKHLLGAIPYQSAGETSCLFLEPKSFRLGKVGQLRAPHEGQSDQTSAIEIFKDVNERRRMCFTGTEGRCFSGWLHGHPTSPRSPPSMDIIMRVRVGVVARRVHANKFAQEISGFQQAMYLAKFKVYIESEVDIYYQDVTELATDFGRFANEFIRGQILFERQVDFVFKTNYGLREEDKKDATAYLCHRSSGDILFQHNIRPTFWRRGKGSSFTSDEYIDFEQPCAMVLYLKWRDWAHVIEVTNCTAKRDNIDPCTIMLNGQPPYPRRVRIGQEHSTKFPYWALDDSLPMEDSFQLARIRFKTREEADLFLRQKEVLRKNMCFLCRTRHKRDLAAHLPSDDIHESLKTCLISSLASVSLISFQTEDVESSHLIHPFSHTVKQFLHKHRRSPKNTFALKS